ncbi:MAG: T9SS type A sorting domain-containing protein [Bacteroidia bacterium]|nr:T9SS type A sorting domain-containing protein [Bacteroidia bacterium]
MKPYQFIPALLLVLFCSSVVAQVPYPFAWVKHTTGTNSSEGILFSYTAPNGDTYVVGRFNDTVDFDPGPATFNLIAKGTDAFVAKYTSLGALVWAKSFQASSSTSYAEATGVAVDALGNIYVCGSFNDVVDFDPDAGIYNLSPTGSSSNPDAFLVKLSPSGGFLWAGKIGSPQYELALSITTDAANDIYVAGRFQDTTDFDMGPATNNLIAGGSVDPFVAKYNSSGALIWAKQFKGNSGSFAAAEKVLISSGNVIVTGIFSGTNDFDPGSGTFNLSAASMMPDFYICQLNSAGNFMWAKSIGGVGLEFVNDMTIDNSGNILLCGTFDNAVDFDPGPGIAIINPFSTFIDDFFVLKLSPLGNYEWAKGIGGQLLEHATVISTNSLGDVFVAGNFMDTVDFDPGPGTAFLYSSSGSMNNGFILKLSGGTGGFEWVKQLNIDQMIQINGIGLDSFENLYLTGEFYGTCDFDPGSGTVNLTAEAADAFILKLNASATNITQNLVENQFKVYPTIAQEYLYIHPSQPANYLLQIIDVNGRILMLEQQQNTTSIPLHNYPNGLYKVRIQNLSTQASETHTFIVQH